jgi:hypothetical protein
LRLLRQINSKQKFFMKRFYTSLPVIILLTLINVSKAFAQGVGINSTGAAPHPNALLHVDVGATTRGFLVTGNTIGGASVPNLGAGRRLMFYPGKSALRAGVVSGTQWDDVNVGHASVALGENTIASGTWSIATGNLTIASGFNSTAMGLLTTASGPYSTAMGVSTIASGEYSFAAGRRVSTNNHSGAFFFGDDDPYNKGVRSIGFDNQFAARFNGGYYFISSDAGADIGVQVLAGGNSWVSMSDENRKENFVPLNGNEILEKIRDIKFSSWNYKTQDPKVHRHYGIMAQDFYKAFGNDKFGSIGNDTTVNPIDMLGIDMAAIQALEKRTALLSQEIKDLKNEMAELKLRLAKLDKQE